jgi:NAD(P)-dependent dehydrogenase (short-subunit alcohol dehydrogenase family)
LAGNLSQECHIVSTRWTAEQIPNLEGKTAVVTGANSGLGWETALELAKHGAHTILACRDATRAKDAVDRIQAVHPAAKVEVLPLDLANLASIREFSARLHQKIAKLDILVNNAGIMAIPRRTTADGFEMQLGTNHFGHFALTGLLLDLLAASGAGRVVTVSSLMHNYGRMNFDDLQGEKRYSPWPAYQQSKLANLLFTAELQRRLEAAGLPVIATASHPGYSATNLQFVGPQMSGSSLMGFFSKIGNQVIAQSAAMGALPSLHAATAPGVKGGDYFGPGGLREMWGPPAPAKRSKAARDAAAAKTLWEKSVALTGVDYGALAKAA